MNKIHKRAKIADKTATIILYITASFFILLLVVLTGYILFQGFRAVTPQLLGFSGDGIGIQLFNTIYLVLISLIISVPIGICAGIYMAEYSRPGRITNILRSSIETLSSLPSIVVGLFAFLILVEATHMQYNLLAGAGAVSILSIPLITRVTEDAIRGVPDSYREGSYGIGATKWQTIVKILIPSALPRIITGIILAAGRGFGEAAALIYTSGMSSDIDFSNWNPASITSPLNIFRPCDTLAVHIWALKAEGIASNSQQIADLSAAVLVILVFLFNLGSRFLGRFITKKNSI
ncbi:MAG: phosphate ABC transporter permease PstA [Clostridia bacterium]|jgi:phosphate transport system permease protein